MSETNLDEPADAVGPSNLKKEQNGQGRPPRSVGQEGQSVESFGEYLARERGLRKILLEEISQKTRISLSVLHALETNALESLPSKVYVKGFLRAYARHVGLDENEVMLRYEDHLQGVDRSLQKPPTVWRRPRFSVKRAMIVAAVLSIAVALGFVLWWRSHIPSDSLQGSTSVAETPAVSAPESPAVSAPETPAVSAPESPAVSAPEKEASPPPPPPTPKRRR